MYWSSGGVVTSGLSDRASDTADSVSAKCFRVTYTAPLQTCSCGLTVRETPFVWNSNVTSDTSTYFQNPQTYFQVHTTILEIFSVVWDILTLLYIHIYMYLVSPCSMPLTEAVVHTEWIIQTLNTKYSRCRVH